jgi:hypothetical protein
LEDAVPPKRCPECGRFLANDLVSSLSDAPAPCPRCGQELRPDTIIGGGERSRRSRPTRAPEPTPEAIPAPAASAAGPPRVPQGVSGNDVVPPTEASSAVTGPGEPAGDSIRPPDLDPAQVRTPDDDVLAGWDTGVTPEEVASWRLDHRPFPTDTVVVISATLVGGLLGWLVPDRNRGRWAALGAVGGAVGAGAIRRIWELTE